MGKLIQPKVKLKPFVDYLVERNLSITRKVLRNKCFFLNEEIEAASRAYQKEMMRLTSECLFKETDKEEMITLIQKSEQEILDSKSYTDGEKRVYPIAERMEFYEALKEIQFFDLLDDSYCKIYIMRKRLPVLSEKQKKKDNVEKKMNRIISIELKERDHCREIALQIEYNQKIKIQELLKNVIKTKLEKIEKSRKDVIERLLQESVEAFFKRRILEMKSFHERKEPQFSEQNTQKKKKPPEKTKKFFEERFKEYFERNSQRKQDLKDLDPKSRINCKYKFTISPENSNEEFKESMFEKLKPPDIILA